MVLSQSEKDSRKRQRMIDKAREYSIGTYSRKFVSPIMQRCIRAEAASQPKGYTPAIVDGELKQVFREVGEVTCITCGKTGPWSSGLSGFHTGHFIAGRTMSVLYCEENQKIQCSRCNCFCDGEQSLFRQFMIETVGKEEVERLQKLKNESISYSREELVDKRIEYQKRLDAAIDRITDSE